MKGQFDFCRNCGGRIAPIGATGLYCHEVTLSSEPCAEPFPAALADPEFEAALALEAEADALRGWLPA